MQYIYLKIYIILHSNVLDICKNTSVICNFKGGCYNYIINYFKIMQNKDNLKYYTIIVIKILISLMVEQDTSNI